MNTDFSSITEIKKPRKARFCIWCGEKTEVGKPLVRNAGVYDGNFSVDYFHPECRDACNRSTLDHQKHFPHEPYEFEGYAHKRGKSDAEMYDDQDHDIHSNIYPDEDC